MITYLKGEHDGLTNFYPCKLVYEGKTYNSAEHIYESQKGQHHRLYAIDREIRRSRSAKQAKQISKSIRTDSEWEDRRPILMAEILKIKFQQCQHFHDTLLQTSGYIAHIVTDSFWGTGHNGRGQNVFGLLLAALRLSVS